MSQDANEGIRWIGQQWQMNGYCGRETPVENATQTEDSSEAKPVAMKMNLKIARAKVVRIGPRAAETRSAAA